MQRLRIKELSMPLKKAREKDPLVEKAALYVEKLFGRPMRSNPDVLIITLANRPELQKILREEYPNSIIFLPLSFLSSDESLRRVIEGIRKESPDRNISIFTAGDMLSMSTLRRRFNETTLNLTFRAVTEEIAEIENPTFFQKLTKSFIAGVQVKDLGMVVVSDKCVPVILVHELIHAEDAEIFGKMEGRFELLLAEGRATFGQTVFSSIHSDEYGPPNSLYEDFLPWHLKMMASRWHGTIDKMRELGPVGSMRWLKSFYDHTVKRTGARYQKVYLPYAIQLNELAREVCNAFTAFQIATEKPPTSWLHVLRLKQYYGDEIQMRKRSS